MNYYFEISYFTYFTYWRIKICLVEPLIYLFKIVKSRSIIKNLWIWAAVSFWGIYITTKISKDRLEL